MALLFDQDMMIPATGNTKESSKCWSLKATAAPEIENEGTEGQKNWPVEIGFQPDYEQLEPIELPVTGTIPAYAAGALYRTGPGRFKTPSARGTYTLSHWFDGFGQTHCFRLIPKPGGGLRVWYHSKSQVDGRILKIKNSDEQAAYSFAQKADPCLGFFGKVLSSFKSMWAYRDLKVDEIDISVALMANMPSKALSSSTPGERDGSISNLWAMTDNSLLKKLDPETLEPIGIVDQKALHPQLKGPMSCAHAHRDPISGDVFNYNLEFGRYTTYRIFRVSAVTGETDILATITGPDVPPAYLHSFFLSGDFVILAIWSSHIAQGGLRVLWERNILDAIAPFDESKTVQWYVVDRRGGKGVVAQYSSHAAFCFHTLNAWQEEREGKVDVVCELMEYGNLDVLHKFYYANLLAEGLPAMADGQAAYDSRLARYRLANVEGGESRKEVAEAVLELEIPSPKTGDLPTINPLYCARPNRYVYSLVNRHCSTFFDGLSKTDTLTKETIFWDNPFGHTPGEAIFVPDPEGIEEDSGVLLSVVLDGIRERSYLLCLDAKNLTELGRANVQGGVVGLGFHGVHTGTLREAEKV